MYVPVRFLVSAAGAAGVRGSGFAVVFLAAGAFAAGFFLTGVFAFAAVEPAFFFIFMGRTLHEPPGAGQAGERGAPA